MTKLVCMRRSTVCLTILFYFFGWSNKYIYAGINDGNVKTKPGIYEGGKIEGGCYRDDKYLYIKFFTTERSFQMQIINFGLIVKIGNKKELADNIIIEYPVVQIVPPPPPSIDEESVDEKQKEEMDLRLKARTNHFILIERNGYRKEMSKDNEKGIYTNINNDLQKLNYEIRVPLLIINKLIGKGNNNINISLNTPKIDFNKLKNKFGIPKEDRSHDRVPPANSQFKPLPLEIKNLNIDMKCRKNSILLCI